MSRRIASALLLGGTMACGTPAPESESEVPARSYANVVGVRAQGRSGAYCFDVKIRSLDKGCERYADWWEVVGTDGQLLFRRVLSHSHVDEQPFERSGEPVPVARDTVVWVRAHMHPTGYGGTVWKGSVGGGFRKSELPRSFAARLAESPPQPQECRF